MFKPNTEVVCVSLDGSGPRPMLTIGKIYYVSNVTERPVPHIRICNDDNRLVFYRPHRFKAV